MDQDATWYGGTGLSTGHIMLDGDAAPPRKGGTAQQPHTFRPMSIVAKVKRSPISATGELLCKVTTGGVF